MSVLHSATPSLRQIQEWLASRILGLAAGDLADPAASLETWLRVPDAARVVQRLRVYVDGYPARIHESLAETYPAVAHFTGQEAFADLARRFAGGVPQTSDNLNDVGAALPAFLRADRLAEDLPFLPDLAELEWRIVVAFHAHERPPLDPRARGWGSNEWASATVQFQPSIAVCSSPWPILALWEAHHHERADAGAEIGPHRDVLVRRSGLTVRAEAVDADEVHALRLLLSGQRLAEVVKALDLRGCDPATVGEWFSRWIAAGMIADATIA